MRSESDTHLYNKSEVQIPQLNELVDRFWKLNSVSPGLAEEMPAQSREVLPEGYVAHWLVKQIPVETHGLFQPEQTRVRNC